MNISLVPNTDYQLCFNAIHDYIKKSAKYTYGRYNAEDIKKDILKNNKQLWIAYESNQIYGFVVTEVITYPQLKSLVMHFTGGIKLNKWKDGMLQTLRKFAKQLDCKLIEAYGRKGWAKVFEQDGYKASGIYFELPME